MIINKSNWCAPDNSTSLVEKKLPCPKCSNIGLTIDPITVRNLVNASKTAKIDDDEYYLCMSPDCDVTYYNKALLLETADLNVPIWFKSAADPKYICYCSKVTEKEAIDAILLRDAKTIKDIVAITGAMKNANCLKNHPTGKCCSSEFQKLLNKYK